MRIKSSKKRTAIHEAGHAVLMYYFKMPFYKVTIEAKDNYLGRVVGENLKQTARRLYIEAYGKPEKTHPFYKELVQEMSYMDSIDRDVFNKFAEEFIIVLFGGKASEELFCGNYRVEGFGSDEELILDFKARLFMEDLTPLFEQTKDILRGYELEIKKLASELKEQKTISGTKARRIFKELKNRIQ